MRLALVLALVGCAGTSRGPVIALRPACATGTYWDGAACKPRGDGAAQIARGQEALAKQDVEQAKAPLDAADRGGPLDLESNITLWEQRGIAAAYLDDEKTATAAFDMLLALDPSHFLSYTLSPKATFVFEKVRNDIQLRGAPALDVNWPTGQKVGDPVPLDVEVIADPKRFLKRATVFVRTRGEPEWRAADVTLGTARNTRITLPPVSATKPVSLELFLRAYDARGNEVHGWAHPMRPREIPLRYDPPAPWYRKWWVIGIAGTAVALGTGITVYALTIAPPDKVEGTAVVE
jgi:hypothetical protein